MHSTTSTMVQHVSTTTRNNHRQRPPIYEDRCSKRNTKHTATSHSYLQLNGLIEIQVTAVRFFLQKCAKTGYVRLIALKQHRCARLDNNLCSLSEILVNRPIRTKLPSHQPTLMQQNQQPNNEQLHQHRDRVIHDHDRHACPELPALHAGQRMRILNKDND